MFDLMTEGTPPTEVEGREFILHQWKLLQKEGNGETCLKNILLVRCARAQKVWKGCELFKLSGCKEQWDQVMFALWVGSAYGLFQLKNS